MAAVRIVVKEHLVCAFWTRQQNKSIVSASRTNQTEFCGVSTDLSVNLQMPAKSTSCNVPPFFSKDKIFTLGLELNGSLVLLLLLSAGLLSPVLQMKVHGRVQVNGCYIQELRVKNAGYTGLSNAEGRGGAGRCQVQPLHRLPRRLAEGHADHPLHLGDSGCLAASGRQRGVH